VSGSTVYAVQLCEYTEQSDADRWSSDAGWKLKKDLTTINCTNQYIMKCYTWPQIQCILVNMVMNLQVP
jgi:hypothetical protein